MIAASGSHLVTKHGRVHDAGGHDDEGHTAKPVTSAMSPDTTKPSWPPKTKMKHTFFSVAVRHGAASTRHSTESPPYH